VRMQLHRRADHIRDLVETPVVHVPQACAARAAARLQAVVDVRHRAVEDDVAGVVEEPVPVADRKRRLVVLNLFILRATQRRWSVGGRGPKSGRRRCGRGSNGSIG
jgi:hypothetical protein